MVSGMRGVGRVCKMCMCLDWGGEVRGEWIRGLGLSFTNPMGTRGVLAVCLCLGCGEVGGVGLEWVGLGSGRVGRGYICVSFESGFFVWMADPGICILW